MTCRHIYYFPKFQTQQTGRQVKKTCKVCFKVFCDVIELSAHVSSHKTRSKPSIIPDQNVDNGTNSDLFPPENVDNKDNTDDPNKNFVPPRSKVTVKSDDDVQDGSLSFHGRGW